MIHVQVIQAKGLTFPKNKPQKARIDCFSQSSIKYFYGSYKKNEKTQDPKWNINFDIDLFRASTLKFVLYSTKILSKDEYIGQVEIDLQDFFTQETGKQIISNHNISHEFQYLISPQNSHLILSFKNTEKVYQPIQFNEIQNPIVHLWPTFDPPFINNDTQNPIELEMIQINGPMSNPTLYKKCFYSHLDQSHTWNAIGVRTSNKYALICSNFTQIHTLFLYLLSNKYNFFILNVFNYTGKITLNFLCEKCCKNVFFENRFYPSPLESNNKIGIIKKVEIQVEANKKYVAPLYLYDVFNQDQSFDLKIESFETNDLTIAKDQSINEIEFHSKIIEKVKNIVPAFHDSNIERVEVLPKSKEVSLNKIFNDFKLQLNLELRIYVGSLAGFNLWSPFFVIFDKNSNQRCKDIESKLIKKPNCILNTLKTNFKFGLLYNATVDFKLDEIGRDKIIVFDLESQNSLKMSTTMFAISNFLNGNETLLFQNYVTGDEDGDSNCGSFFRFEFHNDDWKIIPMSFYSKSKKEFETKIYSLYQNKWNDIN